MKRLGQAIQRSVASGGWKPIRLVRKGPTISHLSFADDMMLFAEASENEVEHIMNILNEFFLTSGQKVSIAKTSILYSKNVKQHCRAAINEACGFLEVDYFGNPLLSRKVFVLRSRGLLGAFFGPPQLEIPNKETLGYHNPRDTSQLPVPRRDAAALLKNPEALLFQHQPHTSPQMVSHHWKSGDSPKNPFWDRSEAIIGGSYKSHRAPAKKKKREEEPRKRRQTERDRKQRAKIQKRRTNNPQPAVNQNKTKRKERSLPRKPPDLSNVTKTFENRRYFFRFAPIKSYLGEKSTGTVLRTVRST
ncbi:hypothetical protein F3Y22_tig00001799pilonHSYRG00058 [Hibiscus syriacus]|uniref:Reverse transcriptase domain-containing protein n=1 Tax=Hibiscus syriacus TaxID=106335 RepID=A0A6A3CZU8_HIBSY|nr:hypothetical protein F3Y22_tig00001799pilonHSYRG00058 [Hibiscus syriacus]